MGFSLEQFDLLEFWELVHWFVFEIRAGLNFSKVLESRKLEQAQTFQNKLQF